MSAQHVGNHVEIGDACVISARAQVRHCCVIRPGTMVAEDQVVPLAINNVLWSSLATDHNLLGPVKLRSW